LFAADLFNTALSATFTFGDRVFYAHYLEAPRLFGTTALGDQVCAGAIMWVPGSLVFLVPAVFIAIHYISSGSKLVRPGQTAAVSVPLAQFVVKPKPFDLLSVPFLGRFLRAQSSRRLMQAALFLIATAVVVDGLFGPQASPSNLAGVLPWTYCRAVVVVLLLAAGNFFCMACPFMLVRELGRRLGLRHSAWPRALRSKWFGAVLLALFFWAYEVFGLWDKPMWTAWLIIDYFLVAFAIDAVFRPGSFCKYVCPIGQYQFVASLVSPLEVKVRAADVCATCKTHDCLRGNERHRGCEMDLHLPRKSGNLDCTFCLDCVRACPHDNIGVMLTEPGMDIVRDPPRSSVGRFSRRLDIAGLALVFVFAAFANAAFMTAPVIDFSRNLSARFGLANSSLVTGVLLFAALIPAPAILAWAAASASRAAGRVTVAMRELVCRFSVALVPLGAAMWAAHFLFHLFVGWGSAWPTVRRAADDLGWHLPALPGRGYSSPLLGPDAVHIVQTILLDIGFLLTLYLAWRICRVYARPARDALRLFASWAGVAAILYAIGVWIILQPMDMRGLAIAAVRP
jgi:ferredoxin